MNTENKVAVFGTPARIEEFKNSPLIKLGADFQPEGLDNFELIIDLNLDDYPSNLFHYAELKDKIVLSCAVKQSLFDMAQNFTLKCKLFGINALPTFLSRKELELSAYSLEAQPELEKFLQKHEIPYKFVEDGVGMVSARVVCMIINEAVLMLQEKGASKTDIDLSMKLGTGYPFGPFEWLEKIGAATVLEVLESLKNRYGERYKPAALLHKLAKGTPTN